MLNIWHLPPNLVQSGAIFFGMVMLVSCGSPAAAPAAPTRTPTRMPIGTPQPTPTKPTPGAWNIIPRPVSEVPTGGAFILSEAAGIYVEPATDEVKAVGQFLADKLNPSTGYGIQVHAGNGAPGSGSIYLTLAGANPALGDEGYELIVTPDLVKVAANQPAGLFHGIQTLRQMLPATVESATVQPGPWVVGTGTISDSPRFGWRGAMLDVARHFFSVSDVTRYIDLLAYYKINRLHLHLSDDQGWRIQIKSWPNLALYGGSLEVGGTPGGYYSQEDYTYLVNYARSRYITIIPEIDMPGHVNAALASYPELNCDGIAPALFTGIDVGFSSVCVSKDITYTFLANVIGELAGLTPGEYIHIGGDEAQATEKTNYINFINRVQSLVKSAGKKTVGWEEIAQSQLLPDSIVQHWNPGPGFAVQAVQQGAKVIMSPADKAYMDMKYDASTSLGLQWAGYINLETGYSWNPATLIPGLTENNILGVEAPIWSETLNTLDDIEYMTFPRILGYAEMGWTPQAGRDWNEYKVRLAAHGSRLKALGVHFYPSPEVVWP